MKIKIVVCNLMILSVFFMNVAAAAKSVKDAGVSVHTHILKTPTGGNNRVVQGLARLVQNGTPYWLISQDPDATSEDTSGGVVFTLLKKDGSLLRSFKLSNGIHPASLVVVKQSDDSFKIYSDSVGKKGFTLFKLSADLKKMKFIKVVEPSNSGAHVFAMSSKLNLIVRGVTRNGLYCASTLKLDEYLAGRSVGHPIYKDFCFHKDHMVGPLQGLSIDEDRNTIFVLSGDYTFNKNTRLYSYYLSNGSLADWLVPEAHLPAIINWYNYLYSLPASFATFEPESLYYRAGHIYYTINTGINGNRIPILVDIALPY